MSQPTCWRGESGRSGLVSSETWHIANEDSLPGGEEEGGKGWRAWKHGTLQKGDSLVGGKEEGGAGWWARKRSTLETRTDWMEGKERKGLKITETGKIGNAD